MWIQFTECWLHPRHQCVCFSLCMRHLHIFIHFRESFSIFRDSSTTSTLTLQKGGIKAIKPTHEWNVRASLFKQVTEMDLGVKLSLLDFLTPWVRLLSVVCKHTCMSIRKERALLSTWHILF